MYLIETIVLYEVITEDAQSYIDHTKLHQERVIGTEKTTDETDLNMDDVKIKLSVLWLFGEVTLLTFLVLELLEPGVINGILAGDMKGLLLGSETLLFYSFSLLIPLVMAFLSLTLKSSVNRSVNIILGVFFTGLYLSDLIAHLMNPYAHAILMGSAAVVAQILIVWYAWKWK